MGSNELALLLARRQKRLNHWIGVFQEAKADESQRAEIEELLNTYRLLISKLSRAASNAEEESESEGRIAALERELSELFESMRLSTSEIGTSVATGTSERHAPDESSGSAH